MATAHSTSTGQLIALALTGAWRQTLPPLTLGAAEFEAILPALIGSGASALSWRSVRQANLHTAPQTDALHQAYRLQLLQAALFEQEIGRVFATLRAAGIEPLLVKGWAAAQSYAEPALRPWGDIDLLVRPEQYAAAQTVLAGMKDTRFLIDLHRRFTELAEHSVGDLFAHSRLVRLGELEVRVLGAEDHFRLLCIHLLRHGAWRPVWLCDVGAALEARPADFAWARCLGTNRRRARWITCAIGLAHRLLGARIDDTPVSDAAARLPRWLVAHVLRQWETPYATAQAPLKYRAPLVTYLRQPAGLLHALRVRWPDPLEATVSVGGAFNGLPRWPFQFANCCARIAHGLTATRNG